MTELNADTLAVCASLFTGVSRGWFLGEDYTAIWEALPQDTRETVMEMLAATQIIDTTNIGNLEGSHS